MQIAATFIEYLVSGCTALLWLLPLLSTSQASLVTITPAQAVLMVPLAYVVGHLVDYLSYKAVSPFKHDSKVDALEIIYASSDLAKEEQIRSSRDRIARGALFNSLCLTLVAIFRPENLNIPFTPVVRIGGLLLLTIICFLMWREFEGRSKSFRDHAIAIINKDKVSKSKDDA